jgi:hypothetical protein
VNGRPRIARPRLSTLRTRISHDARRCRRLNIRLLNNRTKTAKEKTEKDAVGGYDVAALLVAALDVLLCVLRHADHLGDTNGVESSECLQGSLSVCMDMKRVITILADKKMQC